MRLIHKFPKLFCSVGYDAENISSALLSILDTTKNVDVNNTLSSLKEIIYALHVLPHIKPINENKARNTLLQLFTFLCHEMKNVTTVLTSLDDGRYSNLQCSTKLLLIYTNFVICLVFSTS